jgi:hypothetical protein
MPQIIKTQIMTSHYPKIILSSLLLFIASITQLRGQYLYQYFDGNDTGTAAIQYLHGYQ